jgi:hypothetical protein
MPSTMVRIGRKVGDGIEAVRAENAEPQTCNPPPPVAGFAEAIGRLRRQKCLQFIVIGSREINFEAKNGSMRAIVIAKIDLIGRIDLQPWQDRCRQLR